MVTMLHGDEIYPYYHEHTYSEISKNPGLASLADVHHQGCDFRATVWFCQSVATFENLRDSSFFLFDSSLIRLKDESAKY